MSLTSFLSIPDVREKVKGLRLNTPRKIPVPIKVEPRTNRHAMVGTAFDYLLRFELQRRSPHAVSERLIAEFVPSRIYTKTEFGAGYVADPNFREDLFPPREELAKRIRAIVDDALTAIAAYMKMKTPSSEVTVKPAYRCARSSAKR